MGKIYSGIDGYKEFKPNYRIPYKEEEKREEAWLEGLREKVKTLSNDPYAGESLYIPYADGSAHYMVMSLKPVELVHIPLGDAWDAPYVHRMTAKDIKGEIDRKKKIQALFRK